MTWEEFKKKKEQEKIQSSDPMRRLVDTVKEERSAGRNVTINMPTTSSSRNTVKSVAKKIGDTTENIFKKSSAYVNNQKSINRYSEKNDLFSKRTNQNNSQVTLPTSLNNKKEVKIPSYKDFQNNNILNNKKVVLPTVTNKILTQNIQPKETFGDKLSSGVDKVYDFANGVKNLNAKDVVKDVGLLGKTVASEIPNFALKAAKQVEQVNYANRSGYRNYRNHQDIIQKMQNEETKHINPKYLTPENPVARELGNQISKITEKQQQYQEEASNSVSKKILELTPSMTDSVLGMGLNVVAPGAGSISQFLAFGNDYYEDAKQRGMSDKDAVTFSGIMGAMESLTEKVGGELTKNVGKAVIKGNSKQALKAYGLDVAENFLEEAIMEPIQEATATLTGGKETANWENMSSRMLQSGIDGGLTSILMGGASAGIGSATKLVQKIQAGNQVTQEEVKTTIEDIQKNGIDTQTLFEDGAKQVINPIIQANQQNEQTQMQNKEVLNPNQQITQPINQNVPNYKYEASDNVKINNFRQDMAKYYNNSEDNHSFANVVEKVISDKNYSVRLDDTIVNQNGKSVNAQISNVDGNIEIKINPNSERAREILLMHEVTHSIETEQMKKLVNDYASKNSGFNEALNELKQTYGTEDVSDEVLADISGNLFGNQEFISELSMKEPNIFKKIYNKIIEIANKLTGNSKESLFIKDLKNKWEDAYRKNNNLSESKKSIEVNEKGYKYVKADRQVITGNNPEEWKKQTRNYINSQIRKGKDVVVYTDDGTALTITRDTAGKATFRNEVRQADGVIRELTDEEFASKLRAETHIDELGEISKHKNGPVPDTKNHEFAKDGFTYRTAYFEDIDGQYYKITMSIGKNGDINTIYNVGKMQNAQKNRSNSNNRGFNDPSGQTANRNTSINSLTSSDENVNTKYSMSKQENNALSEEKQKRLNELKAIDTSEMKLLERKQVEYEIKALEEGFDTVEEWKANRNKLQEEAKENAIRERAIKLLNKEKNETFSTDNKGRNLTKEQENYFKNSKVRDKKGNLLTLYHGTPNDFTVFNYDKLGTNGTSLGAGFYFSDDSNVGDQYSQGDGKVIEAYVNIEKPLQYGKTTMTKNEYKKFITAINKETNGSYFLDYGSLEDALMEYEYGGDDIDLVNAVHNASGLSYEKTYRILKETTGFDGIISDEGFLTKGSKVYVPLLPEQIKNVNNQNPTTNTDIRYSQTNSKWQEFLDKNFKQTGTRTYSQGNRISNVELEESSSFNLPSNQEIKNTEEKTLKKKAEKAIYRNRKIFIDNIVKNLQTSTYSNKEKLHRVMDGIVKEIEQNGYVSREKSNEYFEDLYKNLVKIDTDYYNQYKYVKDEIRKTKIYVPDSVKNSIADYNDFRLSNMGNLILTNNSANMSIDSVYQELSNRYPNLFPDNIIAQSEQLEQIASVQKDISKVETNVKAYIDKNLGQDYKIWAKNDFNRVLEQFTEKINMAFRYNNDVKTSESDYEVTEIKEIYENIKQLRRNHEKAMSKALLTIEDRRQLDRVIAGDITLEELPAGTNKSDIKKVYQSAFEYKTLQKEINKYKKQVKSQKLEKAKNLMGDLNKWKDKKMGWLYNRETARRNIYDIAPKEIADKITSEYMDKYYKNEAEATRKINEYTSKINDLKLSSKKKYEITYKTQKRIGQEIVDVNKTEKVSEVELVQIYGEHRVSANDVKKSGADLTRINNAVETFQKVYSEVIEMVNDSLIQNGYEPVNIRNDYFPHYTEGEESVTTKISKMLGIDLTGEDLPTQLAGRTQNFKPGKKYVGNFNERKTNITDFNALKAFDTYIRNTTDVIYHTGDITNMRALSEAITEFYTTDEIKKQIKEIEESTISVDEKAEKIRDIRERMLNRSNLSNFINWFDNYINILAGKKTVEDRTMEKNLSRKAYQCFSKVESRVASNMVGFNLNTAISNVAVLAQTQGELNPIELGKGMLGTIWANGKSVIGKKDNSFASQSNFITNRRGTDTTYKTMLDKVTSPINNTLNLVDDFVTESISRAMYMKNLKEGMTQQEALEKADLYTSGLVGDRTKGSLPTVFSNKNPLAKLGTMFQIEVNNQYSYYFKDLARNTSKANAVAGLTKIAIGSHIMNAILGRALLPDPIELVKALFEGLTNDDEDDDWETILNVGEDVLSVTPFSTLPAIFINNIFGVEFDNVGRIPVAGVIPNLNKLGKALSSDGDSKYKKSVVKKELSKPFYNFLLPTGGAQIKKTVEGIKTLIDGGSYTINSEGEKQLQFPAKNISLPTAVKTAVVGKYAIPHSKQYIENNYKTLSAKQTKLYDESKIDYDILTDFFNYEKTMSENEVLESNSKKMNLANKINNLKLTDDQKFDLYKYSLISDDESKDGTSQLSDAEYMLKNGVSKAEYMKQYVKSKKRGVDLPDEEEFEKISDANVSLNTYMDYKINIKQETSNKRLFTGKSTAELNQKEKLQVLNKVSSVDEKEGLFLNYIAEDNHKEIYNNLKTISGENVVNQYTKYLLADKVADRKDDGTKDGDPINGSAKIKKVNAIQSLELDEISKLYLHATEYKLNTNAERSNYRKLKNYISSFDADTQVNIIKTLEGATEMKDGSWQY